MLRVVLALASAIGAAILGFNILIRYSDKYFMYRADELMWWLCIEAAIIINCGYLLFYSPSLFTRAGRPQLYRIWRLWLDALEADLRGRVQK